MRFLSFQYGGFSLMYSKSGNCWNTFSFLPTVCLNLVRFRNQDIFVSLKAFGREIGTLLEIKTVPAKPEHVVTLLQLP